MNEGQGSWSVGDTFLICEKRKVLDSDGKMNCTNCTNKINNKNNIDNSRQAWYIIQAVAWDKTGKCLRAHV